MGDLLRLMLRNVLRFFIGTLGPLAGTFKMVWYGGHDGQLADQDLGP